MADVFKWAPADLNEQIAFINNRRAETKDGSYDQFLYGEVLEQLYRIQDLEK